MKGRIHEPRSEGWPGHVVLLVTRYLSLVTRLSSLFGYKFIDKI
jgi:hypothetical protein